MNRAEYLNQLNKHLRKLSKSDYENAMEYFTEYFEEVGEQQAMEELGTPEEAAADIINNLLSQKPKKRHKMANQGKILLGVFLFVLAAAAIVCWIGIGNGTDIDNIKVDTGNIKVGDIQKDGKDRVQVEGGQADGIKTWRSDEIRLDSVSDIQAELACIDLEIAVSDDNDFYMSYELHCMNRKNPLSYSVENGTLKLAETDFKAPSWSGRFWNIGEISNKYYSYITLYVPSNTVLKSCSLNMADSDVTIKGFHCNLMEIESADGDMNIKGGSCTKAVLKAEDGDIIFSDTTISEDLQVDTADGDISISGFTTSGAVEIMSGDGDIAISDFKESGGLFLQTEYGDISGSSISIAGEMQINTEDGSVALTNLGISGKIDIASEYGDISVQIQKKSLPGLKIIMDTEDGELSVSPSLGGEKKNGHYERNGSASTYLKANTEEGDILIN